MIINVDFDNIVGKIKPMNAVCEGPKTGGRYLGKDATPEFKDLSIPYVRLHDIEGAYGMNQFVDVHCVFPNFDADVEDERNYNFKPTDDYLRAIRDSGAKVLYRLGESIDHFDYRPYCRPPKDYLKWAQICEHIIMHYNYGWASGQYWEIENWEIWNEPESRGMWTGTNEQFYELYAVAAKYLKRRFPSLKIGGYSAVGFYTETRETDNPWFKTIVPIMNGFFDYIKDKDVPLDFFSWHCYSDSPEEIGRAARFIRKYLDDKGYNNAKSYLTEFNTSYSLSSCPVNNPRYVSELAASMIVADDSPMDMMFYYYLALRSYMNGVYWWSYRDGKIERYPAYSSMKFFGDIYKLSGKVKIEYEKDKGVYAIGASDNQTKAVLISVMEDVESITLKVKGGKAFAVVSVDELGNTEESALKAVNGECVLKTKKYSIYFMKVLG